jgi:hypothetical protein
VKVTALVLVLAACSSGGSIPDRPCCSTGNYPALTVRIVGDNTWEQPTLGPGLGDAAVDVRSMVQRYRRDGHSWGGIAALLNAAGVATPSGRGQWHRSTVEHFAHPEAWAAEQARRRGVHGG